MQQITRVWVFPFGSWITTLHSPVFFAEEHQQLGIPLAVGRWKIKIPGSQGTTDSTSSHIGTSQHGVLGEKQWKLQCQTTNANWQPSQRNVSFSNTTSFACSSDELFFSQSHERVQLKVIGTNNPTRSDWWYGIGSKAFSWFFKCNLSLCGVWCSCLVFKIIINQKYHLIPNIFRQYWKSFGQDPQVPIACL